MNLLYEVYVNDITIDMTINLLESYRMIFFPVDHCFYCFEMDQELLNFLDYSALATIMGVDPVTARSHGILIVEIGVGIAVMATMIWIYNNLASAGKYDEGL